MIKIQHLLISKRQTKVKQKVDVPLQLRCKVNVADVIVMKGTIQY
jgi:hypothetical protein